MRVMESSARRGRACRAALLFAGLSAASASSCTFATTPDTCPALGAPCTNSVLCQAGQYCNVESFGQSGSSYSGTCATGPTLDDVRVRRCCVPRCGAVRALTPGAPPTLPSAGVRHGLRLEHIRGRVPVSEPARLQPVPARVVAAVHPQRVLRGPRLGERGRVPPGPAEAG